MSDRSSVLLQRVLPFGALILGCAVVVALILSTMSSLPASPKELFHELQRVNKNGELSKWWGLLTEDARQEFATILNADRAMFRANSQHAENASVWRKYNVTLQEFYTLSPKEMFIRELSPPERRRWMEDARILDINPYSGGEPGDYMLRWEAIDGRLFHLHCRETDRGYAIVRQYNLGGNRKRTE